MANKPTHKKGSAHSEPKETAEQLNLRKKPNKNDAVIFADHNYLIYRKNGKLQGSAPEAPNDLVFIGMSALLADRMMKLMGEKTAFQVLRGTLAVFATHITEQLNLIKLAYPNIEQELAKDKAQLEKANADAAKKSGIKL